MTRTIGVGAALVVGAALAGARTPAMAVTSDPEAAGGHVRGTAYTFNTPDVIVGAEIRVVELPDVVAVTGADGSYELDVPIGATVTPYVVAAGHDTVHHQTFVVADAGEPADDVIDVGDADGVELDGVNFQTPSNEVYDALRGLIAGYTGRDPFAGGTCVVVTTVGDARMAGMAFEEFIDFRPHGVAGASAVTEPAMGEPIYFNDAVVPDLAQGETSSDGGVLWANVEPGVYEISATHPDHDFATITVTCAPDRVVNASPVWGVRALT